MSTPPTIIFTPDTGTTLYSSRAKTLWENAGSPATFNATIGTTANPVETVVGYVFSQISQASNKVEGITLHSGIKKIESNAFQALNAVTYWSANLTSITEIEQYAFQSTTIDEVTLGPNLTTLSYRAFYNCDSLKKVTFPNDCVLNTIWSEAFQKCTNLTEVNFGTNTEIRDVGYESFRDCSKLSIINLDALEKLTSISNWAFYNTGLINITLPNSESLYTIGSHAFYEISTLAKVTFGTNIANIGYGAFQECNLTYNTGGNDFLNLDFTNLTEIDDHAFSSNANIKKVALPTNANYTKIDNNVFRDSLLTELTIPDNVTEIGQYTFRYSLITSLIIPKLCWNVSYYTFYNSSIRNSGSTVNIKNFGFTPQDKSNTFGSATITVDVSPVSGFSNTYLLHPANPSIFTSTDADQIKDQNALSKIPNFMLPDSVTEIGNSAFKIYYNQVMPMKVLRLGANTTIIGEQAFDKQIKLETILIKKPLVSIGSRAFENCWMFMGGSNVATSTNPTLALDASSTVKNLLPYDQTVIGYNMFYRNKSLHGSTYGDQETEQSNLDAYYNDTTDGSTVTYKIMPLKIPTTVVEIGQQAFAYYNSNPSGVTSRNTSFNFLIFTHFHGSDYSNSSHYSDIKVHYNGNSVSIGNAYVNNISLKKIGTYAFSSRTFLRHMLVGPSLTEIRGGAFYSVSSLRTFAYTSPSDQVIQINPVTTILGSNCFGSVSNATQVLFFGGAPAIQNLEAAFDSNQVSSKIEATYLHTSNSSEGPNLLGGNIIFDISFQVQDGVTSIATNAYRNELKFTKVVFPAEIVSIGQHAFDGCNALTDINFSSSAASVNGPTAGTPFLSTGAFTGSTLGATAYNYSFHNDFNEAYKNPTYFSGGFAVTINVEGAQNTPSLLVANDINPNLHYSFYNTINISENVEVLSFTSSAFDDSNGNQVAIEKINFPLSLSGVTANAFEDVRVTTPSDYLRITGSGTPLANYSFYNTNVVKVVDLSGSTGDWSDHSYTFAGANTTDLFNNINVYLPKFDSPQNFNSANTFHNYSGIIYLHPEDNNAHAYASSNTNIISGVVINSPSQMTNDSYILKYTLREHVPTANPFSYVVNNFRIPSNVGAIIELGSWANNTSNNNVTFEYIHTVPITSSLTSDELYNAITVDSSKQLYLRFSSIKLYPGYKLYLYGSNSSTATGESSISVSNNETTIEFKSRTDIYQIQGSQMFDNTNGIGIQKNEIEQQMYLSSNSGIPSPPTYTILLFFENKLVYRNSVV